MLTTLLARHVTVGERTADRFASWWAALRKLRTDWDRGERIGARQLPEYLDSIPEEHQRDALQDLVAEHLRLTWKTGNGTLLETYFGEFGSAFVELSSPETVNAELVEDEFLARYQEHHGDMPSLDAYRKRFPARTDILKLLTGRCLDGERFVKLRKHGLGAFGEVWEAHDRRMRAPLAIKEPRLDLVDKADALRRFAEEARVTAELEHPGIVTMREHWTHEDTVPFYTMRLLKGDTLSQHIRDFHLPSVECAGRQQRCRWTQLLQLFVMICDTVAYAHARGVVHRDLKPGNIVVEQSGHPVILDWGMAVRSPGIDGKSGLVAGTPDYMPPEQADGRADARSDVFGLGAVLYEILTARSPHGWSDGCRPANWKRLVREAHFHPPHQLRPQTPWSLETICMKALARDPDARYRCASELAQEVRRLLANEASGKLCSTRAGRWVTNFFRAPAC